MMAHEKTEQEKSNLVEFEKEVAKLCEKYRIDLLGDTIYNTPDGDKPKFDGFHW